MLLALGLAVPTAVVVTTVAAPPAQAGSYWRADPWSYCWQNRPQANNPEYRVYWNNPGVSQSGYTTYCRYMLVLAGRGWASYPTQVVNWDLACKQQYGWSSYNIFAPGWPYYQACYRP